MAILAILAIIIGALVLLIIFLDKLMFKPPEPLPERVFTDKELESLRLRPEKRCVFFLTWYGLILNVTRDSDEFKELLRKCDAGCDVPGALEYANAYERFFKRYTDDTLREGEFFVFTYREEPTNIIYFVKMQKKGMGNYSGTGYAEFPEVGKIVLENFRSYGDLFEQAISLLTQKTHKFLAERDNKSQSSKPNTNEETAKPAGDSPQKNADAALMEFYDEIKSKL